MISEDEVLRVLASYPDSGASSLQVGCDILNGLGPLVRSVITARSVLRKTCVLLQRLEALGMVRRVSRRSKRTGTHAFTTTWQLAPPNNPT